MSSDPQPPTEPPPPSPSPVPPQTARPQLPAWPEQGTRPQTWPEQPTVPGQHTSPRQAAWPQQAPAPPPSPPAWPQQPPTGPPHPAWPPPPARGQGTPGHGGHGRDRYRIREQPAPQYREQYAPGQQAQEWAPLPLNGREMHEMTVAPKNPAVSVLLSIFIPGLGSMVNENVGTGVAILVLNIIGWILAIVVIGIPLAIATWIWGLVDAYKSAQRWNRAHGIIS